MQYALQKLAEEEARAVRYLETQPEFNSVPKLVKVCFKTFVVDYMLMSSNQFLSSKHQNVKQFPEVNLSNIFTCIKHKTRLKQNSTEEQMHVKQNEYATNSDNHQLNSLHRQQLISKRLKNKFSKQNSHRLTKIAKVVKYKKREVSRRSNRKLLLKLLKVDKMQSLLKIDRFSNKNNQSEIQIKRIESDIMNESIQHDTTISRKDLTEIPLMISKVGEVYSNEIYNNHQINNFTLQTSNAVDNDPKLSSIFDPDRQYHQFVSILAKLILNSSIDEKKNRRLIKLTPFKLEVLQNLLLIFTFIQSCVIIYLIHQYDINLRLRSPLNEFPSYAATRMPWIPGQYTLKCQISTVWWSLCLVYIPVVLIFCRYFLDHNEKELKKEKHNWITKLDTQKSLSELGDKLTLSGKNSRQYLLMGCLIISTVLWLFYAIVLYYYLYFIHLNYWHEVIHHWLYELQRFYYLHFNELHFQTLQKSTFNAYHLLDDGKNSILIIDIIQSVFKCCGVDKGFVDWLSDHIENPKFHTDQNTKRILNGFHEVGYSTQMSMNRSIPLSCYKTTRYSFNKSRLLYNMNLSYDNIWFHEKGCIKPLLHFLTKWMKIQMLCLLIVIFTMIPQIILMLASIQVEELRNEMKSVCGKMSKQKMKFTKILKFRIPQLKKISLVHIFSTKDDEAYFRMILRVNKMFYYEQLNKEQIRQHELSESRVIYNNIELTKTDVNKLQVQSLEHSKSEQLQQPCKSTEHSIKEKQNQYHQRIQQSLLRKTPYRKSTILNNLNTIPIKPNVHVKHKVKLVNKRIRCTTERPIWKYSYKG
ncbi:hypothetical protein MN116_000799 [Schistosoma mekongi]|uniref:Uncharacterized protein n=1 Tax=Schistosoma mekongi TaxID=38744 RepID=A0AAE1ZLH4_SCHME|nr:hypothetical protein MN116_000799 [Schistosoma mekongi]